MKALRRILTEPRNAIIKQYEKLFEMDGIKLNWDEKVLDYIVQKAWNSSWELGDCAPFAKPS
jgi:ATP-dependent Clp protease ATP-binding subunit ClpX